MDETQIIRELVGALARVARACSSDLPSNAPMVFVSLIRTEGVPASVRLEVRRQNGAPLPVVPPPDAAADLSEIRRLIDAHPSNADPAVAPGGLAPFQTKWRRDGGDWRCTGFSIGPPEGLAAAPRPARSVELAPWRIRPVDGATRVSVATSEDAEAPLHDVLAAIAGEGGWPWTDDDADSVALRNVGTLSVPSGRLMVWAHTSVPLEGHVIIPVPPGALDIAVAELRDSGDPIAAVVRVRAGIVALWGRFGHPDASRGPSAWNGGAGSTGTSIAFADIDVASRLEAAWRAGEAASADLAAEMNALTGQGPLRPWGAKGPDIVSVDAGLGGPFPVYGGVDSQRKLSVVVIPFVTDGESERADLARD